MFLEITTNDGLKMLISVDEIKEVYEESDGSASVINMIHKGHVYGVHTTDSYQSVKERLLSLTGGAIND